MPPTSRRQARFMRAVASGSVKKKGLSRRKAKEFVEGEPTKDLPETAPKRKKKSITNRKTAR